MNIFAHYRVIKQIVTASQGGYTSVTLTDARCYSSASDWEKSDSTDGVSGSEFDCDLREGCCLGSVHLSVKEGVDPFSLTEKWNKIYFFSLN